MLMLSFYFVVCYIYNWQQDQWVNLQKGLVWYLIPLLTIFQWWRKPEFREKTTDKP
jgi:hypothetical protein